MTKVYLYVAAAICGFTGVAWLAVFVLHLFHPGDGNRVDELLRAYAWIYIAALHILLARPSGMSQPPGGSP